MPYIKQEQRDLIDDDIANLVESISDFTDDEKEGVLNYTITSLLNAMPGKNKAGDREWRYKFINRVVGVLECVKLEFYRRLAGPYEDVAIEKNGDIKIYE